MPSSGDLAADAKRCDELTMTNCDYVRHSSRECRSAMRPANVRRERPNWGLALLMRPAGSLPANCPSTCRYVAVRTLTQQLSRPFDPAEACLPPCQQGYPEIVNHEAQLSSKQR